MTGGLPGPAAMTFFPVFMATLTTASPPVMDSSGMSGCSIMVLPVSSVGFFTVQISAGGPPAFTMASLRMRIVSMDAFFAAGCGL